MNKMIYPSLLFSSFILTGCLDDSAKQCETLFRDENKKLLVGSYCEQAANQGNPNSQYLYAQLLLDKNQPEQAVSYLEKSANQGHSQALYQLGELFLKGKGVDKNPAKATYYWQQSCNKGEQKACANLFEREQADREAQAQVEKREQARQKAEEDARLAKEREEQARQKVLAEREAKQKAEQARLEAERKAFEQQKQAEQARLAEQRQALQAERNSSSFTNDSRQTDFDPSQYTFYEGLAKFEQDGKVGYLDTNGNIVISAQFKRAGRFSEGIANVQGLNGLWGYIDKSGRWIVEPIFVCSARFLQGLAGVYWGGYINASGQCVAGKWGFLNKSGDWAIQPVFDEAQGFSKDTKGQVKAKVTYQGNSFYIDRNGNPL